MVGMPELTTLLIKFDKLGPQVSLEQRFPIKTFQLRSSYPLGWADFYENPFFILFAVDTFRREKSIFQFFQLFNLVLRAVSFKYRIFKDS